MKISFVFLAAARVGLVFIS